jgi:hypothetical protein
MEATYRAIASRSSSPISRSTSTAKREPTAHPRTSAHCSAVPPALPIRPASWWPAGRVPHRRLTWAIRTACRREDPVGSVRHRIARFGPEPHGAGRSYVGAGRRRRPASRSARARPDRSPVLPRRSRRRAPGAATWRAGSRRAVRLQHDAHAPQAYEGPRRRRAGADGWNPNAFWDTRRSRRSTRGIRANRLLHQGRSPGCFWKATGAPRNVGATRLYSTSKSRHPCTRCP